MYKNAKYKYFLPTKKKKKNGFNLGILFFNDNYV